MDWPNTIVTLIVGLVISVATAWLTVKFSLSQFRSERWWERKANAYGDAISVLVAMAYSLQRGYDDENRRNFDESYNITPETRSAIHDEFRKSRERIEQVAIEGDYILSRNSAASLLTLVKELQEKPDVDQQYPIEVEEWLAYLRGYENATKRCIETLRKEAKFDLQLK